MIFKKEELLPCLEKLKPFISKKDSIPILHNISFTGDNITAFNGSVGSLISFDTKGINCLFPFDKFYIFIKGASSEIKIKIVNDVAFLTSGKKSSEIPILDCKDFPSFQEFIDLDFETIEDNFITAIKNIFAFSSKKSISEVLTGVSINKGECFATDGMRIAKHSLQENKYLSDKNFIIIPEFCKRIVNLKAIDGIFIDETKIVLLEDDTLIFGNLMEGEFPNISKYFENIPTDFIELPNSDLKKSLITIGDFTGEVLDEAICSIKFGKGIEVKYEGKVSNINEIFSLGKKSKNYPVGEYKVNPYHFSIMLNFCDKFVFIKDAERNIIYAESTDGVFKAVLALAS